MRWRTLLEGLEVWGWGEPGREDAVGERNAQTENNTQRNPQAQPVG